MWTLKLQCFSLSLLQLFCDSFGKLPLWFAHQKEGQMDAADLMMLVVFTEIIFHETSNPKDRRKIFLK